MPLLGILASSKLTAAATSYESIATVTVGAGGASSVSFSSIAADWKHLQIRGIARRSGSTGFTGVNLTFNDDTGANYAQHYLVGNGSNTSDTGSNTSTSSISSADMVGGSQLANTFAGSIIDILDYANGNKNTTIRVLTGGDVNGGGYISLKSGHWRNINAVTKITLTAPSNFAEYSTFALYGIKGA